MIDPNDTRFWPKDLTPEDRQTPNSFIVNPRAGIRKSNEWDSFTSDGWNHDKALDFLKANGFQDIRVLEDGSYCGIYKLAFTWSVCTDITPNSVYCYRWCFEDKSEADKFLKELIDFDDVPDLNIYKSLRGHRYTSEARVMAYDELGFRKW